MIPKKILIFDTSILCCWLNIPGKETCGALGDQWDHRRISDLVELETQNGATFVLPIASIIETGNHVAQAGGNRFALANGLAEKMKNAAQENEPWAAFSHQSELWEPHRLQQLAEEWPNLAAQGLGIGDATIKDVADFYAKSGTYTVEILTGDAGLKAYEPRLVVAEPRRRKNS